MASTMSSNNNNDGSNQATKSIDVGSMFLMDLSIQESDSSSDLANGAYDDNNSLVFPIYHQQQQQPQPLSDISQIGGANGNKLSSFSVAHQLDSTRRRNNLFHPYENNFTDSSIAMNHRQHQQHQRVAVAAVAVAPHHVNHNNGTGDIIMATNIINNNSDYNIGDDDDDDDYLASSLDRLASAIHHQRANNGDNNIRGHHHHNHRNNNYTTSDQPQHQHVAANVVVAAAAAAEPVNNTLAFNNGNSNQNNKRSININSRRHLTSITVAQPQPPPELGDTWSSATSSSSSATSSSSLSLSEDESFAMESSSGTSLSASFMSNDDDVEGVGAGHTRDHEQADRVSTATREDSGVLDLKDLDSNQSNGTANTFDELASTSNMMNSEATNTNDSLFSQKQHQQETPISPWVLSDVSMNNQQHNSTNLITKTSSSKSSSKANLQQHQHEQQRGIRQSHSQQQQSTAPLGISAARRSVSASLPIQVPARQMKKDLNKLKLNNMLMEREFEAELANDGFDACYQQQQQQQQQMKLEPPKTTTNRLQQARADDLLDEEDFLDQEFNENHQNHYPNDEFDGQHLKAEENPMKLFASIQALAKSLHEDAELFGSLPPKRLLESPIRSIALV